MDWVTLTDYASKYKVSVSTLRRRIKSGKLPFEKQDGKYMLPDQPMTTEVSAPVSARPKKSRSTASDTSSASNAQPDQNGEDSLTDHQFLSSRDDLDFSTAKLLLGEIKRAYTTILQEKEEQIVALKHEMADLNTLVRALERENQRLQSLVSPSYEEGPLL